MILAGDIGGTNSRLALFDEKLNKLHEQTFRNEGRASLTDVVREFLSGTSQKCARAAFGVAGPVKEGTATMTNLPWKLEESGLSRELGIAKVALINDLVAHAEGIELLRPEQIITIHEGDFVHGNRAVIAAGTGLGEAGILWDAEQHRYRAFASEGGHADFAPRDGWQIKLLQFLHRKYENASWERVLSGPGLRNIYDYWVSVEHARALPLADPSPRDISQAGLKGKDDAATYAVETFVAIYGQASANLALKFLATGGMYIAGGIALGLVERLKSRRFTDAFLHTGPMNLRPVLQRTPVHIVKSELNGLYGAANYASRL